MIQKLKQYRIKRANTVIDDLGEEVRSGYSFFSLYMCIAVSTGSTTVTNLVSSTNSTHTGIFYDGDLQVGDLIIDDNATYIVKYVYPKAARNIANLQLVQ